MQYGLYNILGQLTKLILIDLITENFISSVINYFTFYNSNKPFNI